MADPLADARLTAVLESIGDADYAVDRDWRIVMFNGSAETFFGVPRTEILGLAEELRGAVRLDFRPEGLACVVQAMLDA